MMTGKTSHWFNIRDQIAVGLAPVLLPEIIHKTRDAADMHGGGFSSDAIEDAINMAFIETTLEYSDTLADALCKREGDE